ncbi:hypothetical protein HHK36_009169 [Tetracentron sinense]|uniref:Uncharacterized protein n=1 Tax=Tetracentron sinense TaxID=13715 RepID=A0A834ZKM6_TETSI|nr:hypothetical protein HHK36_009169 [Tetracentron sinense]
MHLKLETITEWQGKPFPFSRGCSFYRLKVVNGKRQIIYGRDSVEPSIKPGETALDFAIWVSKFNQEKKWVYFMPSADSNVILMGYTTSLLVAYESLEQSLPEFAA